MTKRSTMLMALAVAGICAVRGYAQGPPGMPPHLPMLGGPGRLIPVILHETDLTADQQTQAQQILDTNRAALEPIFTQLKQANDDLANLLLGPGDVQADAVATQLARISQLQQQLAQNEANTVVALRGILTADQLAKADAAKDDWHPWHHTDCPGPPPAD